MAEKVVDEEEFEFDERAVEGGLLHLFLLFFLPAYLLVYFLGRGCLLCAVN